MIGILAKNPGVTETFDQILAYALMVNALALHRHRRRQPEQMAAA